MGRKGRAHEEADSLELHRQEQDGEVGPEALRGNGRPLLQDDRLRREGSDKATPHNHESAEHNEQDAIDSSRTIRLCHLRSSDLDAPEGKVGFRPNHAKLWEKMTRGL